MEETNPNCPVCGTRLTNYGTNRRKDGTLVRRWYCKKCHKSVNDNVLKGDDIPAIVKGNSLVALSMALPPEPAPDAPQAAIHGLSETELREKHDLKYIIFKKCSELVEGVYLSHVDFVRYCGIQGLGFKEITEKPEFNAFHGKTRTNVVYWSHPNSIAKMKKEYILT